MTIHPTEIRFTSEPSLLCRLFGIQQRDHVQVLADTDETGEDGEYIDNTGILWSVQFRLNQLDKSSPNKVAMFSVKPHGKILVGSDIEKV